MIIRTLNRYLTVAAVLATLASAPVLASTVHNQNSFTNEARPCACTYLCCPHLP